MQPSLQQNSKTEIEAYYIVSLVGRDKLLVEMEVTLLGQLELEN